MPKNQEQKIVIRDSPAQKMLKKILVEWCGLYLVNLIRQKSTEWSCMCAGSFKKEQGAPERLLRTHSTFSTDVSKLWKMDRIIYLSIHERRSVAHTRRKFMALMNWSTVCSTSGVARSKARSTTQWMSGAKTSPCVYSCQRMIFRSFDFFAILFTLWQLQVQKNKLVRNRWRNVNVSAEREGIVWPLQRLVYGPADVWCS